MDLLRVAKRFAALAALCLVAGTLTLTLLGPTGVGARHPFFAEQPWLHMWIRWDAGWYQAIATNGYSFSVTEQSPVAFFPLYPLLMRSLTLLGANAFIAGMVVTFICGLFAVFTFYRWAATLAGPDDVNRATWLLVLWPFAYYLVGAIYSDALFLLLITSAFWMLERRRVGWATLLGALATATRPVAPAVVVALVLREWELSRRENQPLRPMTLLPALSCVGLLAYMAFLWSRFDDPLAFLHAQTAWRQTPGPAAWFKLALFQNLRRPDDLLIPLVHAVLSITLFALAWRVWKTLGLGYAAYVVIALGIPLISSRDFIGLGRYSLAAFPSLLALSTALGARPRWAKTWMVASGVLLIYMVSRFAMGSYIS